MLKGGSSQDGSGDTAAARADGAVDGPPFGQARTDRGGKHGGQGRTLRGEEAVTEPNAGRQQGNVTSIADFQGWKNMAQQSTPDALVRMVEGEIIPRLLVNCRADSPGAASDPADMIRPDRKDVDMLASSAIREDARQLLAQIDSQIARGMSKETRLLDVMAPAARLLGEWWEQDACDFIDVTMGLWRLQEAVHEIIGRNSMGFASSGNQRSALFAVVPGDDHGFGSVVLEEMFRRSGWTSEGLRHPTRDELQHVLGGRHFDLLALTASTSQPVDPLKQLVAALRTWSRNPDLLVMVGGWMFNQDPTLVQQVGADASAPDARAAVQTADAMMQERCMRPASAVGAG